jgi:hypothetical protein
MDSVIYEDSPYSSDRQRGALWMVMLLFIIITLYCVYTVNFIGAIGGFAALLIVGCYHWLLFPRKYQVLHGKLRIVLAGPLHRDIPFDNLVIAGQPARKDWFLGTSLGFGTYFPDHSVQILQKKSRFLPRINISPCDREKFLEQLNNALNDWRAKNSQES